MSKVFVNIGLSLDGYMAPEGMTMDNPEYKSWGAKWVEVDGFVPDTVRIGRNSNVPVVSVPYRTGIGDAHLPRHRLERGTIGIDERYIVPAYAELDNEQLAAMLERYRDRYG